MNNAWGGADPVEAVDADDYELGTRFRANNDITLRRARVWTGAGEINITNRKARVWSTGGAILAIASLPDDLPPGWSEHDYDTPLPVTAGTQFVASFSTGGNEGALPGALLTDVTSADGNVTALAAGSVLPGNGLYNLSSGAFPNTGSGNQSFYGADVVYDVGIGGNTAPRITGMSVTTLNATATAGVTVEDDETLVNATCRFNWGDGTPDTVLTYPNLTASHTYAYTGMYAVLATVTDADGAHDYEARPVLAFVPSPLTRSFTDAEDIVKAWLLTTAVAPLVTVSGSVKIFQAMPKGSPLPCVILSRVGGAPQEESDAPIDAPRISFEVWAANRPQAKTIAKTLLSEIEQLGYSRGYTGILGRIPSATVLLDMWAPDDESDTPRYIVDATFYIQAP
jgi:hypothetical protein